MDKELLRIVIIATGLLVMIGMILWSYLNGRQQDDELDDIPREKAIGSKGKIDESLRIHHEHDEFDIIPIGSAKHDLARDEDDEDDWGQVFKGDFANEDDLDAEERLVIPDVLQFAIMTEDDAGFNGVAVDSALRAAGLTFGNLKVYERINANGNVDYGVACMVQPGTFPEGEALAAFSCPGVVFYLQHGDLENAQEVFDDFVDTIRHIADQLDGEVWDHQRQSLTESTVQAIRQSI